ncbi:hypothetical protein EGO53_04960 [Serratia liquefaciens]|uniref:Uncharacterized protein n=1 Tax=Serratia liquefaciens TaxID=614 RepID=A0A515CSM4_SERLI|nr:hypothetical protein EGO53_04960 [Serratia liquefaciens]
MALIGRKIIMGMKAPTLPPYKPGDKVVRPAPPPPPPRPFGMGYQPRCCCGASGSECRRCPVNPPPKQP